MALHKSTSQSNVLRFLIEVFKVNPSSRNVAVSCPFHHESRGKKHMYVSTSTGVYICFKCEAKGSFTSLVFRVAELDETVSPSRYLLDGIKSSPKVKIEARQTKLIEIPKGAYPVWIPVTGTVSSAPEKQRREAVRYLEKREISEKLAEEYRLHFAWSTNLKGRVIIPVIESGQIVSWVARDYTGQSQIKVLTPPSTEGSNIKHHIFNYDSVINKTHRTYVLVEGVFDAMKHGHNFMALFGKDITDIQMSLLVRQRDAIEHLVLMLDTDAQASARELAKRLLMYFHRVSVVSPYPYKDPGEAPVAQIREMISGF